jgi:hypothetical protein
MSAAPGVIGINWLMLKELDDTALERSYLRRRRRSAATEAASVRSPRV